MSQQINNESKEVRNIDSDIMRMEDPYESANQQRRLTARTEGYTKTRSKKKVVGNSFCTTTFTKEIRHLDPLTETHFVIHYSKHYFSHTLHIKCSELHRTLHNVLYWFLILIHPF
jgi:arginine utilization protein RocB